MGAVVVVTSLPLALRLEALIAHLFFAHWLLVHTLLQRMLISHVLLPDALTPGTFFAQAFVLCALFPAVALVVAALMAC